MKSDFTPEDIEETSPMIIGHLLIRDAESGEIFVNQRGDMVPKLIGMDDDETE